MPPSAMIVTLAQSIDATKGRQIIFWCAVLLGAGVLLGVSAYLIRRRMLNAEEETPLPMGFSLSDLRLMHERGELTDEEYEHARRKMVARTRSDLDRPVVGAPSPDDADTAPELDLDRLTDE